MAAAPLAGEVIWVFRANHAELMLRVPDDAFYYLEIAQRIGRGEGFTFDGEFSTNGFHPLWQFVLIPISWLTADGSDAGVRASLLVGLVLIALAVVLIAKVVARAVGPFAAIAGVVAALHGPVSLRSLNQGMESAVVLLILALLLMALANFARDGGSANAAAVGAACAAMVLARLDYAVVVPLVPILMWWRERRIREIGPWFAGFAAVGLPAGVLWIWRFGHVLTTSASIKQHQQERLIREQFGGRGSLGYMRFLWRTTRDYWIDVVGETTHVSGPEAIAGPIRLIVFGVVGIGAGLTVCWAVRHRTDRLTSERWSLVAVAVVVGFKFAVELVTAPSWAAAWYSAPERVGFGIVFGVLLWRGATVLWEARRATRVFVVLVIVAATLPLNLGRALDAGTRTPLSLRDEDLAADWVLEHGPDGRYGSRDAGLLGYRLDGRVQLINLDGLVNDYDFVELVVDGASVWERAAARSVTIYVGRVYDFETVPECGSQLWQSPQAPPPGFYVAVIDLRSCSAGS